MSFKPEVIRKLENYYHMTINEISGTGMVRFEMHKYYFRQNGQGEVTAPFLNKGMKVLIYLNEHAHLTRLSLGINQLEILPETFAHLKRIKLLDLGDNRP